MNAARSVGIVAISDKGELGLTFEGFVLFESGCLSIGLAHLEFALHNSLNLNCRQPSCPILLPHTWDCRCKPPNVVDGILR